MILLSKCLTVSGKVDMKACVASRKAKNVPVGDEGGGNNDTWPRPFSLTNASFSVSLSLLFCGARAS